MTLVSRVARNYEYQANTARDENMSAHRHPCSERNSRERCGKHLKTRRDAGQSKIEDTSSAWFDSIWTRQWSTIPGCSCVWHSLHGSCTILQQRINNVYKAVLHDPRPLHICAAAGVKVRPPTSWQVWGYIHIEKAKTAKNAVLGSYWKFPWNLTWKGKQVSAGGWVICQTLYISLQGTIQN